MLGRTRKAKGTNLKTCSRCQQIKSLSEYHFRKDSGKYRNICKKCWQIRSSAKRLNITFDQAEKFYENSECLCCGEYLPTKRERHIHHVNHKVKGILCMYCNISLGQETPENVHRIKSCLEFMISNRENLFDRDNQQGSRQMEPDPSTTTRRAQSGRKVCKTCKKRLPESDFYYQKRTDGIRRPISRCKECQKIYVKSKRYGITFEQVAYLRQRSHCDCCKQELKIPFIHHVGDKVLGAVCPMCNTLLEQESDITKHKLQCCDQWLVMI